MSSTVVSLGGEVAEDYTRQELMAATAAREFADGETCFIGTGLPMIAAYLAKATHAPNVVLVFESGTIDAQPRELAEAVGDFRLLSGAARWTGLYDALSLLQRGAIDLGFLGAAELDRFGNINTTAIGPYERPKVRLPGSGGANDIASMARAYVTIMPHERRKLVERVQYITTPGFLDGPGARERAGLPGCGPRRVITDLAVLGFDDATKELRVESIHPGVTADEVRANTGFPLEVPTGVATTPPPTPEQVRLIREVIDPDGIYIAREQGKAG
jgi:acyl CoA:acetate/3-ketoacid CoA transferase beta subunit